MITNVQNEHVLEKWSVNTIGNRDKDQIQWRIKTQVSLLVCHFSLLLSLSLVCNNILMPQKSKALPTPKNNRKPDSWLNLFSTALHNGTTLTDYLPKRQNLKKISIKDFIWYINQYLKFNLQMNKPSHKKLTKKPNKKKAGAFSSLATAAQIPSSRWKCYSCVQNVLLCWDEGCAAYDTLSISVVYISLTHVECFCNCLRWQSINTFCTTQVQPFNLSTFVYKTNITCMQWSGTWTAPLKKYILKHSSNWMEVFYLCHTDKLWQTLPKLTPHSPAS